MPAAMLECDFCGCYSPDPTEGWVAFPKEDYAGIDEPMCVVYCPRCAAAEYGHRPDVAAEYVCIWEPQPSPSEPIES